jgi:hypothetical protein
MLYFFLGVTQVRALGLSECCSTFGLPTLYGRVAQLAEHSTLNRQVGGSIPPASTKRFREFGSLVRT